MEEQDTLRDYFGFDLGDGETAVAWLGSEFSGAPLMLEIAGRKSLLTALGRQGESFLIGEQACLSQVEELHVRFKSRFLSEQAQVSGVIRDFARQVLREIRSSGRMGADSRFFIGCPSGWNAETRETYRRLFLSVGFPNVQVVSESRAAFLFVRESGELRIEQGGAHKPALVIDAGSSTTDFTIIRDLKAVDLHDFGENHLGGGLLDKALLNYCVEAHREAERIRAIFSACPQYEARCEIEARKVKEMFFAHSTVRADNVLSVPCESSVKLYYENPPIRLDITCDERIMRRILREPMAELGGAGYLEAYRNSLYAAKDALGTDSLGIILLTGGASRMPFMEYVAQEAFPDARIVRGAEPEFSIARGLCYALRIDMRTERFERDVRELIESGDVERIVSEALPSLFDAIAPVIVSELVDEIGPVAFKRWKRGEIKTFDDMSRAMADHLSESLMHGALKEKLAPVTGKWLEGLRPALEALTDPICLRCRLPLTSLRISSETPLDGHKLAIDAGVMVNLDLLQTVIDLVVGALVAALLGGGGTALLMSGPVGLLVSFVIGFIASRLGTTLMRQHVGSFDMPAFMRALFTQGAFERTMNSRREELVRDMRDKLSKMLEGPDPAIEQMQEKITATIEGQLGDMAREARLLIH